jgi:PAS domain-containing protein
LRDGHCELEMRNQRKSGEECFIRISLSLLRDEADQPYAMLGVSTDISSQKHAERALRESEERYRGPANSMPHVAYITGVDGKTKLINQH